MSIKDILVHADSSENFEARLRYALALSQHHEAHLTTLYVLPNYSIPAYVEVPMDPEIMHQLKARELQTLEKTRARFEQIVAGETVSVEWRDEEGDPTLVLNSQGRYFDLVILGQADPNWRDNFLTGLADDLVIGLGRPCLVLPYIGAAAKTPKRILVAWNGGQSAARAINDSMPLLQAAEQVEVMSINPEHIGLDEGDVPSADISLHLARHGVNATARGMHAKEISEGDVILSHASDFGADLLVTGAYGHSRFREIILGGVTRHLLRYMTVPVFMSH